MVDRTLHRTQFQDVSYLKNGTIRQQEAYTVLYQNKILDKLRAFTPVLTGTVPINIDIKTSDLDIICYFENKIFFRDSIIGLFGTMERFLIKEREDKQETIVASFYADGFMIEIFGQNIPCHQQSGYRHMVIEHQLLNKYGETFRRQIIHLKKQGYKTEPAFAKLLELEGDPYEALLRLEADATEATKDTHGC